MVSIFWNLENFLKIKWGHKVKTGKVTSSNSKYLKVKKSNRKDEKQSWFFLPISIICPELLDITSHSLVGFITQQERFPLPSFSTLLFFTWLLGDGLLFLTISLKISPFSLETFHRKVLNTSTALIASQICIHSSQFFCKHCCSTSHCSLILVCLSNRHSNIPNSRLYSHV